MHEVDSKQHRQSQSQQNADSTKRHQALLKQHSDSSPRRMRRNAQIQQQQSALNTEIARTEYKLVAAKKREIKLRQSFQSIHQWLQNNGQLYHQQLVVKYRNHLLAQYGHQYDPTQLIAAARSTADTEYQREYDKLIQRLNTERAQCLEAIKGQHEMRKQLEILRAQRDELLKSNDGSDLEVDGSVQRKEGKEDTSRVVAVSDKKRNVGEGMANPIPRKKRKLDVDEQSDDSLEILNGNCKEEQESASPPPPESPAQSPALC